MTASKIALLAAVPFLLACGQPGASEEMREADGEANAEGTYIPENEVETARTGPAEQGTPDAGEGLGGPVALPPGGDAGPEAQDDGSQMGNEMGRSPDIISAETRARFDAEADLERVVADQARGDAAARDEFRHPAQTLAFFGLAPDMTVVEIWPGGGYYADILGPYLAEGGRYVAVASERPGNADEYRERFGGDERFGDVAVGTLGEGGLQGVEPGSADMVLTFRNVHNWHMGGWAPTAFEGFYEALAPGGVLGVVEHRLPEDADDGMQMSSGYMKQSAVVAMAEAAGFELAEESELNANPEDDADHPFGVWTLPPVSRTEDRDGNAPEGFDAAAYEAIGESDRMTLRFVKPIGADGALME